MATAPTDEWTEVKCIQLIREYRIRPILWDPKNPLFFKKPLKPEAWEAIGRALNIHADTCKHKMMVLMSSFRREKAKIMNSIKEGDPSQLYKSTWFAFKEMSFLMDKESERKRQRNGIMRPQNNDDNEENEPIAKLPREQLSPPSSPMSKQRVRLRPIKIQEMTKMYNTTSVQEPVVHTQVIAGPSTISESDEEIKAFTNFIMNKMKKYSESTKNAVQQAICEVIFKADQNFYENQTSQTRRDSFHCTQTADSLQATNSIEESDDCTTLIKQSYSDSE